MYGINETNGGPAGAAGAGGGGPADEEDEGDVEETGFELKTGSGCRWKGNRMFKKADSAWTGTLCCAWSRKYCWHL